MKNLAILVIFQWVLSGMLVHAAGLGISVTADKAKVAAGNPVCWNVLLSNSSASDASGVQLRLSLPFGMRAHGYYYFDGAEVLQKFISPPPPSASYPEGGLVTYEVGTLGAGESHSYQIILFPESDSKSGREFTMTAQADSDDDFVSAQASVVFGTVRSNLVVSGSSVGIVAGQDELFEVSYSYFGKAPLKSARISVVIPQGVSAIPVTVGAVKSARKVTWELGTLVKGDNGKRVFKLRSNGVLSPGTLGSLAASLNSGNSIQSESDWPLVMQQEKGLKTEVSNLQSKIQVVPGEAITWMVKLSNPLPVSAKGVKLRLTLPAEMYAHGNLYFDDSEVTKEYFNPPPPDNAYTKGSVVTFNVGTMLPGSSRIYQVSMIPIAKVADGRQFFMTARADSTNGIPSGTGRHAVSFAPDRPMAPGIVVLGPDGSRIGNGQPKAIPFGSRNIGKSSKRKILIGNTGNLHLTRISASLSGPGKSQWKVKGLKGRSLAPGKSMTLVVSFTPDKSGVRTAKLKIRSDDQDQSPFLIKLSGTGR